MYDFRHNIKIYDGFDCNKYNIWIDCIIVLINKKKIQK